MRPLRALAGAYEDDVGTRGRFFLGDQMGRALSFQELGECRGGLLFIFGDGGEAVFVMVAASGGRVSDLGERCGLRGGWIVVEKILEARSEFVERGGSARRDREEKIFPSGILGGLIFAEKRSFFENDVGVGAAEAEGADSGKARRLGARPRSGGIGQGEARCVELNVGIEFGEVETGWNFLMLEGQGGLDKPGDASGGFEMAEIRFDGAKDAILRCAARGGGV